MAIDSILAQKLTDFALVILENNSTDNTLSIVNSYDDPRISIIQSSKELDIYESWRRIYSLIESGVITSEFSTIIGHDDIFYPMFLKNIESSILSNPNASIYQTHFDLIDDNGNVKRACKPIPYRECAKDFFLARCWGLRDSFGTGYVFRTTDYMIVGGLPDMPQLLWSDDLLVMNLTNLSYKVCDGESSFAYRVHHKSTSGAITIKKFTALAEAMMLYVKEVENNRKEFLLYNYDKLAFGYFITRYLNILNLPFRSKLLGDDITCVIEQINTKIVQMVKKDTGSLPEANVLEKIWLRLGCYYHSLILLRKKYLTNY